MTLATLFGWARRYALHVGFGVGVLAMLLALHVPAAVLIQLIVILGLSTIASLAVRRRWPRAGSLVDLATGLLAIVGVLVAVEDRRLTVRYLLPVLAFSAMYLVVVFLARIAARWREAALVVGVWGVMVGILTVAGPQLARRLVPAYTTDLDHRPKPFDATLRTNEDGIVAQRAPSEFHPGGDNIIFLGDSFTQGVRSTIAFPAMVESLLTNQFPDRRIRVANFGWTSSSPVLQVRQMLEIGAKYNPKLVVQCLDMTDFHDDLKYTQWFRERGIEPVQIGIFDVGWAAVSRTLGVLDYWDWLQSQFRWTNANAWDEERAKARPRYFAVGLPLERTEPLFQTTWNAILDTHGVAEDLGARYVLVVLPRYQQFNPKECPRDWETDWPTWNDHVHAPFEYFRRRAVSAPFRIYSLLEPFKASGIYPVCFPDDPHWNEAGHEIAARAITEFLVSDSLLD